MELEEVMAGSDLPFGKVTLEAENLQAGGGGGGWRRDRLKIHQDLRGDPTVHLRVCALRVCPLLKGTVVFVFVFPV